MRKFYQNALKKCFHNRLFRTRVELGLTQAQMADRLMMDDRSYIDLDHGKSSCSAITLVLFLLYCCRDPLGFLEELRGAFEPQDKPAA